MIKSQKMKRLILDVNLLIYIYDILSLVEKDEDFLNSNTISQLQESNLITTLHYLRRLAFTFISFLFTIFVLKKFQFPNIGIEYGVILGISIIFGILFMMCKENIGSLIYQLKAKKAVQFALEYYSLEEFKLFLDQFMSELSTKNYFTTYHNKKL